MSISTALTNLKALVDALSGVRTVTNMPESVELYPSCVTYPLRGNWSQDTLAHPLDVARHTLAVEVGVKRSDLPRDMAVLLPFIESVRGALADDQTLSGEVLVVEGLTYQVGGPGLMQFYELGLRFEVSVMLYEDV